MIPRVPPYTAAGWKELACATDSWADSDPFEETKWFHMLNIVPSGWQGQEFPDIFNVVMGKVKQPKPPRQRKMEKNFIAINQKGYSRYPYKTNTLQFLLNRAQQELDELKEAIQQGDTENAQNECADVSNIIDYIFEALQNPQIKQCDVKDCQHCQNGKCTFQAVRIDSVSMCAYVNRYPPQQTAKKPSITERIKCQ